jgi:hypothetical protein
MCAANEVGYIVELNDDGYNLLDGKGAVLIATRDVAEIGALIDAERVRNDTFDEVDPDIELAQGPTMH